MSVSKTTFLETVDLQLLDQVGCQQADVSVGLEQQQVNFWLAEGLHPLILLKILASPSVLAAVDCWHWLVLNLFVVAGQGWEDPQLVSFYLAHCWECGEEVLVMTLEIADGKEHHQQQENLSGAMVISVAWD